MNNRTEYQLTMDWYHKRTIRLEKKIWKAFAKILEIERRMHYPVPTRYILITDLETLKVRARARLNELRAQAEALAREIDAYVINAWYSG